MNQTWFTLTTDFGNDHWYIGVLHSIILKSLPDSKIINLCHCIPPFDVNYAALGLAGFSDTFPKNTIHIVVVDPGVGSDRDILIAQTEKYYYIFPESALLYWVLKHQKLKRLIKLKKPSLSKKQAQTFHAKDIIVPAAIQLSQHKNLSLLGKNYRPQKLPIAYDAKKIAKSHWRAKILGFDNFGNAITNFPRQQIKGKYRLEATIGAVRFKMCEYYTQVSVGQPLAYFGSMNFLELGLCQGNARNKLLLIKEQEVEIFQIDS